MLFRELVEVARRIASTSSRSDKVSIAAELISKLEPEEAYKCLLILTGRLLPPSDLRALNVSWSTLWKVVRGLSAVEEVKGADVGEAVEHALSQLKKRQTTLESSLLTVDDVYSALESLASLSDRARKEALLSSLLSRLEPMEAWLLANAIVGETRLGLSEGLLIDAVALTYRLRREEVERASMVMGSPYEVVRAGGKLEFQPRLFRPLRPMLAQSSESLDEALRELRKCALEFKLDGMRVQVHKSGSEVRLFSRRMSDITSIAPEIVDELKGLRRNEAILEGEVIAERGGRPLAFQDMMRRFRRKEIDHELIEKIPLRIYLFDVLLADGRNLLDAPYEERRRELEEIAGDLPLVPALVTEDLREAQEFMSEAIGSGHEGVIAKDLRAPYVPGARGRYWLKIKAKESLDLVIVAAERGYGRRSRWYSDYYLAARNEGGGFSVVGKTFKGLNDEEFEWMTRKLEEIAIRKEGKIIFVKPEVVVEVAFNEVQRSPKYESGYALRFARIVRIRDDKIVDEADTLDKVKEIYLKSRM
ncbi:MAG: ATP-dependent DNA ligase [Candidatus Korarchaeum sp.]|nr:ATP-dependent DNA ligase [Candidatus Korarchaeum sp.]MDW8035911.1 ATP-dependent DNA ligase [Candidatus Korarchaeum sp.]